MNSFLSPHWDGYSSYAYFLFLSTHKLTHLYPG
jgi:hypothetical protein